MLYTSISQAWKRYFKHEADKQALIRELMSSDELKRAKNWKIPTFSCGCFVRDTKTNQKKFQKAYTFSSAKDAGEFYNSLNGTRKHIYELEIVSVGYHKLKNQIERATTDARA